MVGIWEMGIFLSGIGVLILCIFTATTIRDFGILAKKLDKMIDDNEEELKVISRSTAGIVESLDSISSRVDKIFGVLTAFEQLKSVFKRDKRTLDEDIDEILDEVLNDEAETDSSSSYE
ncbi:MAG: hypothetical protein ACRDA4_02875 [Filifactoraceae bacterium]